MKFIRLGGAFLLVVAGYLLHIIVVSDWTLQGKLYIGIIVLFLVHIGIACVVAKDTKSFKENLADALSWPINFSP